MPSSVCDGGDCASPGSVLFVCDGGCDCDDAGRLEVEWDGWKEACFLRLMVIGNRFETTIRRPLASAAAAASTAIPSVCLFADADADR